MSRKKWIKKHTSNGQTEVVSLKEVMRWLRLLMNADQSVSAAGQCVPGEGLNGDGGLSDHEEQLPHRHHTVGLLDY